MRKKLRSQIAAKLRERNLGPLYTGNKKRYWRRMKTWELKHVLWMLSLEPGDIVNDCDGFNHRIKGFYRSPYRYSRLHKLDYSGLRIPQFEFEDGRLSCGCSSSPVPAWTPEEIEKFHRGFLDDDQDEFSKTSWARRLEDGFPVCDENGFEISQ